MDSKLKQRILIAIVILALIVIFVPMLFRKHQRAQLLTSHTLPTAPPPPKIHQMLQGVNQQQVVVQAVSKPTSKPVKTALVPISAKQPPLKKQPLITVPAVINHTKPTPISAKQPPNKKIPAKVSEEPKQTLGQQVEEEVTQAEAEKKAYQEKTTQKQKDVHHKIVPLGFTVQPKKISLRKSSLTSSNVESTVTSHEKALLASAHKQMQGWVIQLGSFKTIDRANLLIGRLRKRGIAAYTYETKLPEGVVHRVYAGPMTNYSTAKAMEEHINKRLRMKSFMMKFNPLEMH